MENVFAKTLVCWAALLLAGSAAAGGTADCELAERYLGLARDRIAVFDNDEASAYLEQSIGRCPTYAANQQLGELAAESPELDDKRRAVEAFVVAYSLADTPEGRSRTLYHYGRLLSREGDPQNAYPLLLDAQALAPGNSEVDALLKVVRGQIESPTPEQIVRGLRDSLYQPIMLVAAVSSAAIAEDRSPQQQVVTPIGPSVNIPINFVTGSTRVDGQTRGNVVILARALADPELRDRRFLFVGHADVRGDEFSNLALSRQRAEAIHEAIILIEPALIGRIETTGRGAYEPIDPGSNEQAWRANRRLQVLLQ